MWYSFGSNEEVWHSFGFNGSVASLGAGEGVWRRFETSNLCIYDYLLSSLLASLSGVGLFTVFNTANY